VSGVPGVPGVPGVLGVPAGAVGGPDSLAGTLVCVGGAPGAGKTTVGAFVAAAGGLCLVDLDSVTTPLVEAFAASLGTVADLDAPQFAALRAARYTCLGEVVADNLRAGRGVVAVAPFSGEAGDAVAWREQALAWGATRAVLVWLDVDPEVAAARAAARGLPRDLAKAGRDVGAGGGGPSSRVVDRSGVDLVLDGSAGPQDAAGAVVALL
jgi:predicted kinase